MNNPAEPEALVYTQRQLDEVVSERCRELREAKDRAEVDRCRFHNALRDIAEEWAGAECGEPVHAQEAYAIGLAKRMYALAVEGLRLK